MSPLAKRLALFLFLNGVVINAALLLWRHEQTSLNFTYKFAIGSAGEDSWLPMRRVLRTLAAADSDQSLYAELFKEQAFKFQYPPSSLLPLHALRAISENLTSDRVLNSASWLAVLGTLVLVAAIAKVSVESSGQTSNLDQGPMHVFLFGAAAFATLTYYPIVKSYSLGQAQTWINFLFPAALLAYMTDRKILSGAIVALIAAVKPQLALLLIWGLLRREWKFAAGMLSTGAIVAAVSVWTYGIGNHWDYLRALAFLSRHGEGFYPNQSMNGLLNRMLFNGDNLVFSHHAFPPFNKWVYAGTMFSSAVLIGMALFWRRNEHRDAEVVDLLIASLSFTLASPIAWEHHYGITLPMFVVSLSATLKLADRQRANMTMLIVSYFLCSNFLKLANDTALTPFNFLQSYLFIGAVLLLILLYRLRRLQHRSISLQTQIAASV